MNNERRIAEETLRESEQRWRSLTEALPQLVWSATPDGACDYFSPQWTEYTGVAESKLLGWRWMDVLHPDDRQSTRQIWTDSVAGRRAYDVEYRVRRHDGTYGWFKTRGVPIRDSNGNIVKWFGSCTDINDRKRAEEALRESEQELRKARDELEMKVMERTAELQRTMAELTHMNRVATAGVLLASIAHEINQPLTGIVITASAARRWLALREPSIEEAQAALDQIESDGHRAGEIIASLRGMFKKETQARNLIDVNEMIFTVLAIVRHELQEHGVELRTELDGSLPALEGDGTQLQQVVLNLVMNAIEAMQSAAPRILSIRSCVSKPNFVHVAVEDTGTGIDPSNHNHIFNPMFTTKERGMGIGLSICRSIIESHHGRIWVTRGIDKGSIFQFELPYNVGQGDQVRQH